MIDAQVWAEHFAQGGERAAETGVGLGFGGVAPQQGGQCLAALRCALGSQVEEQRFGLARGEARERLAPQGDHRQAQ